MKVRYVGGKYINGEEPADLIKGKVYDVLSVEMGWYRIIDEDPDDDDSEVPGYLYPPQLFEIVEE